MPLLGLREAAAALSDAGRFPDLAASPVTANEVKQGARRARVLQERPGGAGAVYAKDLTAVAQAVRLGRRERGLVPHARFFPRWVVIRGPSVHPRGWR